ncbi:MAG: metallophosphoesterase family protein [Candidatus Hydrogenedentota bacterium]
MIFAAFGGIRGEFFALEAILAAVDAEGIQTLVNTGDCVVGGPMPNEVIELLRSRRVPSVQGQADRQVVRFRRTAGGAKHLPSGAKDDPISRANRALTSTNLEFLRVLPRTIRLEIDEHSIVVCHGTLTSQAVKLGRDTPDDVLRRQREIDPADVIVCGGGDEAHTRMIDGTLFVNTGSVIPGKSQDRRARYVVISTEERPFTAKFRAIEY